MIKAPIPQGKTVSLAGREKDNVIRGSNISLSTSKIRACISLTASLVRMGRMSMDSMRFWEKSERSVIMRSLIVAALVTVDHSFRMEGDAMLQHQRIDRIEYKVNL